MTETDDTEPAALVGSIRRKIAAAGYDGGDITFAIVQACVIRLSGAELIYLLSLRPTPPPLPDPPADPYGRFVAEIHRRADELEQLTVWWQTPGDTESHYIVTLDGITPGNPPEKP